MAEGQASSAPLLTPRPTTPRNSLELREARQPRSSTALQALPPPPLPVELRTAGEEGAVVGAVRRVPVRLSSRAQAEAAVEEPGLRSSQRLVELRRAVPGAAGLPGAAAAAPRRAPAFLGRRCLVSAPAGVALKALEAACAPAVEDEQRQSAGAGVPGGGSRGGGTTTGVLAWRRAADVRADAATSAIGRSARGEGGEEARSNGRGDTNGHASAVLEATADLRQGGDLVEFHVGGRTFKVPAQLIRARPATRLAQLLAERAEAPRSTGDGSTGGGSGVPTEGAATGEPICVSGAAARFTYILDWYRYGQISVPSSVPIAAVLKDARELLLPESIIVNGSMRGTKPPPGAKVARDLIRMVLDRWRGFGAFFGGLLGQIEAHFRAVGEGALNINIVFDFQPFALPLYGDSGWLDAAHVCSAARARALALKLEEEGYRCHFSDTELMVKR